MKKKCTNSNNSLFFKISIPTLLIIFIVRSFVSNETSLSFGYYSFSNFENVREKVVSIFNEHTPELHIEYETGILKDDYSEWLYSKFLKGNEPDIFIIKSKDLPSLISKNMLMNLNESIDDSSSFDPSVYYNNLFESGIFENKVYALPIIVYPELMYVNKTLLDTLDIPFPKKDWTWSDFHLICRKLTYYNSNEGTNQFGYTGYSWIQAAYSNRTQPFTKGGKEININDINFINSVNYSYRLDQMNEGEISTAKDFDKGNVAFMPISSQMYLKYNTFPGKIEKQYDFEYDIISMPAGPHGDNISSEDVLYAGISSKSKKIESSWSFLRDLSTSINVQNDILSHKVGFPVIKGVLKNKDNEEILSYVLDKGQPTYKFQLYDELIKDLDEGINNAYSDQNNIAISLKELYFKIIENL